jgi:hypothetical protein
MGAEWISRLGDLAIGRLNKEVDELQRTQKTQRNAIADFQLAIGRNIDSSSGRWSEHGGSLRTTVPIHFFSRA